MNRNLEQSVPSLRTIQEVLVALEDKEKSFVGSREWIGSFEVSTTEVTLPFFGCPRLYNCFVHLPVALICNLANSNY